MRITLVLRSSHFDRSFKRLTRKVQLESMVAEEWFRVDCFDSRLKTHKLSGKLEGVWAFSVTQKHRVLFRFITDTEVVFDEIGDHDIYR